MGLPLSMITRVPALIDIPSGKVTRRIFLGSFSGSIRTAATIGMPDSARPSLPVKQTCLAFASWPLRQNLAQLEKISSGSNRGRFSANGSNRGRSPAKIVVDGCLSRRSEKDGCASEGDATVRAAIIAASVRKIGTVVNSRRCVIGLRPFLFKGGADQRHHKRQTWRTKDARPRRVSFSTRSRPHGVIPLGRAQIFPLLFGYARVAYFFSCCSNSLGSIGGPS